MHLGNINLHIEKTVCTKQLRHFNPHWVGATTVQSLDRKRTSEPPSSRTAEQFSLNLGTGRSLTDSDDTRCCINTIWPPEDEQDIAWNMCMYSIVINVLKICASSWSLAKVKKKYCALIRNVLFTSPRYLRPKLKRKGKVLPCTGTGALYGPYGP